MPRVTPKEPRFKPDDVCVAFMAFATDIDGIPYTIPRGSRLRGDHLVVRTCPAYFQLDGVPSDEALSEWNFVAEAERHEPEFTKPTPPIPAGEAVVCLTSFSAGLSGRKVVKGQRLRRDDPLVQEHPAFFATFQPLTESSAPASL